ncbi:hypothetical protein ES705_18532 [subsurface metagenome]
MGIKSPATYGEHYWALQVEASKLFADEAEDVITPYMAGVINDIPNIDLLPAGIQRLVKATASPSSFAFLPFAMGVGINAVDEALDIAFESSFLALKRYNRARTKSTWLTTAEVNTLWSRNKITEGLWDEVIAAEGYEDVLGNALFESQLPYPSIPDFVLYSRYHGDPNAPITEFQKWYNISPREWPVWKWLGLQRLTSDQTHTLLRRRLFTEAEYTTEMSKIGWSFDDTELLKQSGWSIPNAMLLVQGNLQQRQSQERILADISKADINPEYARTYLDAILTKPASSDIVAHQLRLDPTLSGLNTALQQIGIHPDHIDTYRTLAYPIPPVADIITMAVREAFTPAIAEKFGQYEDYPPEFEQWAMKKGLSTEWSKRYWAAHWSLPSASQGFEMLHRGAIEQSELNMLLRALDIMPFWREKLTKIAYRRLTRVDVRRMYKAGVLTQEEVYEAYLEHGYTEKNARRMTEFTVQWATPQHASITRSDILTAYKNRMITRPEASDLLADMGEEYFHREFMLKAVDYKKGLELTENKIKGIRNLYKKRAYDANKTIDELSKLDLPAEEVSDLMTQWFYELKEEEPRRWTTAQTLSFIKTELITKERGIKELAEIGYDDEHINIYIRSIE